MFEAARTRYSWSMAGLCAALIAAMIAAITYLDRLQSLTAEIVTINVTSLRAAEELELTLRDLKNLLSQYAETGHSSNLQAASHLQDAFLTWFQAAKKTATTPHEQSLLNQVDSGYQTLAEGIGRLADLPNDQAARQLAQQLANQCTRQLIPPCHEYLQFNEDAIGKSAAVHHQLAMRLRFGLLGALIIVPLGGVCIGLLIAQRMHRERVESREHLMRAEQFAAVGRLAAGMAHELRNPLTSILMLVQTSDDKDSHEFQIIEDEAHRMERTIQTYLDFAKPPCPHRIRLKLRDIVESVHRLTAARIRHQRLDFSVEIDERLPEILADAQHIHQLLLNLMLNAMDSVGAGGRMGIRMRPQGRDVEILVWDEGTGIPLVLLPRIFEPFVSTKENGTGLGLSICRQIVESHGGTISARNLPTKGAEFSIRIQALEGACDADSSDSRRRTQYSAMFPAGPA